MAAGRSRTKAYAGIYEDFQPKVEHKEEPGANILLIHIPGFQKKQISVTYVDSSRKIKVDGERAIEKNRRSRLDQAFPVPQNCIIEKIKGSFRNGVLTITMPKETIAQLDSPKQTTPPKPTTDQKQTSPPKAASTSASEKQKEEKILPPPPPQTPQKAITETKAASAMGPPKGSPKPQTNGKKIEALQPSKKQEETQTKAALTSPTKKKTEEKTATSSAAEIVEKKADESKTGLNDLVKEKENGKTKVPTMTESYIPKIPEKGKKDGDKAGTAVEEKAKEGGSRFLEKAKEMKGMDTIMKTIKRLSMDDYEDQQLLINIGVSVLVIAAVGAYLVYSYRSSAKARD
ncbi:hypothetical protein DITRI_Ditri01bG0107600 [Diplodiscus trichospermus]